MLKFVDVKQAFDEKSTALSGLWSFRHESRAEPLGHRTSSKVWVLQSSRKWQSSRVRECSDTLRKYVSCLPIGQCQ